MCVYIYIFIYVYIYNIDTYLRPSNSLKPVLPASQAASQPTMQPRTGHTTHQGARRVGGRGVNLQIRGNPYGVAGRDRNGPSICIFCAFVGTSAADPPQKFFHNRLEIDLRKIIEETTEK